MPISPGRNDTIELTSEQVRNEAIGTVETHFEIEINGYKHTSNEIWDILLYASASGKTINYACMNLEEAPSCNLIYTYLTRSRKPMVSGRLSNCELLGLG